MGAESVEDLHGSLPATIATLCMAAILAPLAYAQFGATGPLIIVAFSAAIILSIWVAAWGATALSRSHPVVAGLFASSGIRMIAPLAIALAVVVSRGQVVPVESVYYVVPLYLCMLAADVAVWVRETPKPGKVG